MIDSALFDRRRFLQAGGALATVPWLTKLAATAETAPTIHEQIRADAAAAELSLQFTGRTPAELAAWQMKFRRQLGECLGPHRPPNDWQTTVEARDELADHTRHRLILSAAGHPNLPVYLLVPRGKASDRRPAVLALHGHGAHGYEAVAGRRDLPGVEASIDGANYDYGLQLVRQGYVVAVPCFTPFGRRVDADGYGKQDPCAVTFVRMQLLGKVLIAENLRDALWALELLVRRDDVDEDRLGCVGLSYGGRMTMLATAMEPRIKGGIISGALNLMQERVAVRYSCGAQVIPGLLRYGDVPEIASLIAPRLAVWELGDQDGLIKPEWAERGIARMRAAYRAGEAEDQLVIDRFPGKHRFHGEVGYPALAKRLQAKE